MINCQLLDGSKLGCLMVTGSARSPLCSIWDKSGPVRALLWPS